MTLVLGIDSSTQSTKALLVDATDGTVVERRQVPHPPGTEVDPRAWLAAVDDATADLLPRAAAVAVGGQQHGMVALDADGAPVRDALLWNDVRSAGSAADLVAEWGGPQACADLVGSTLVSSFTAAKLRWTRDHEPAAARRVSSVLLPHDYVSRHLSAPGTPAFTDRGDASGTGYFSPREDRWLPELAASALGHEPALPRLVPPGLPGAETTAGAVVGAGTGDNMAAALGMQLTPGDVLLSVGTSGVASMVSASPTADGSGAVTGFCDATGRFLPMTATLNAAQILDLQCRWLGVDHDTLSALALESPSGAQGVSLLPYYGGERTPNRPEAVGTWTGLRTHTTRADLARAAFESLACSLTEAVGQITGRLEGEPARVLLVGGAARSEALRVILAGVLGRPVLVAEPAEYVAIGAARQAAWTLAGATEPPPWPAPRASEVVAPATPEVLERYALLRERTRDWEPGAHGRAD
ncbi:FGGY family carbohydrate kinase [Nocardioides nitrophenolicus]|uniref:FGGY family carbohydrate kinase n=1 Tax=Nocardioides nitrophenolicus TaxID=60489 RepID=UPI001959F89D|nr:FGGY family carbohydrate kinase [Nocardioides nitrophenolicus]MBM7518543.1 xylulokinase [Nocardioides nitrophenolicus]